MKIEKRSLIRFIILDILTFGIYGIIAIHSMGNDIDALCKGDGRKPRFGYVVVWLMPLIGGIAASLCSLLGYLLILLVMSLFSSGSLILSFLGTIFLLAAIAAFLCGGACTTGAYAYIKYWWYQQNNRLKLNAWRYNVRIRESGLSAVLWQTLTNISAVSILALIILALPTFLGSLIALVNRGMAYAEYMFRSGNSYSFLSEASALVIVLTAILCGFAVTAALGIGKYIAVGFMIKNLNRLSASAAVGGERFNPMGYEYYKADRNFIVLKNPGGRPIIETPPEPPSITCVSGSLSGYTFDMKPGEEIVLGRDAKQANVVIDPAFKQIGRKHCGIRYDEKYDYYRVTDYSTNGTFENGRRLAPNAETTLPRGTVISLVDSQNAFRLD